MIHNVINAKQVWESYKLELTFQNWEMKVFDMEPYIGEGKWFIFWPLKHPETFKLFKIQDGTVVWETWADLDPNVLYDKSISLELV